ncbi:MAG: TonB-dependent receptor [Bacteroidales bacterium]|nr:TonB-dependent receptor [Bacteroidales bacterium]
MRKLLQHLLLQATFVLATGVAFAQNVITGRVLDSRTNDPLAGATVIVITDSQGASTDIDGNFTLRTKKDFPLTLHIGFVGYRGLDVDVYDNSEPIDIHLQEKYLFADEVVVIGYGQQKRGDLAGSVTTVDVAEISKGIGASFNGLLDGSTSGLQATPTSGQPGAGVSLRIRGGSSVEGGNEPLYVIDDFPIYNDRLSGTNDPLSAINPGDIESVTVLKDASATAIYGSRGANGVIIIKTKRAKSGEQGRITYDGSVGWQSLRKKYEVLNAREFAELYNDALYDGNPAGGQYQYMTQEEIDAVGEGTDWQDAAYRNALVTNHQISVSGGSEKTRYVVSGNYYRQDGILINTGFDRVSGRINLDSRITDKLNIGLNVTASKTNTKSGPSNATFALLQTPATATIYDADGSYTFQNPFNLTLSNPIASIKEQVNKQRNYRLLGTAFGEYEIVKDLKLKILAGTDITAGKSYSYTPSYLYEGSSSNGSASLSQTDVSSWLNENTLTYATTLRKVHTLNFLLGFTQQETTTESLGAGSSDFVSDALTYNNLGSGSVTSTPSSSNAKHSLISFLSRVNYNFDDRHSLSLSLRRDGSSRFGKDSKWGTFPSVGYSWNIGNEAFFSPLKETVSNVKLRLSYGVTGNQEIGNYQSLATLSSRYYTFADQLVVGFYPTRIANDELSWETTAQFDAGLDFGFIDDRLTLSLDYYHKKTDDLLLNVSIPYTSGYSTSLQNYGSVLNQGFEFTVSARILTGKLTWDASGNLSLNRNKVLDLGGSSSAYITGDFYSSYIIEEGQPLGTFYGAIYDGVLQTGEEESKGAYTYNQSAIPGDRLYRDIDGDGKFTNAEDRTAIGNAEPDFTFGLNNKFSYRNFDLSFFINGSVGNEIANVNKVRLSLFTGAQNAVKAAADRWRADSPSQTISRAKYSDPAAVFSSEFVEDGTFVRLKNITLGYTFSKGVVKQLGISGLRLYATATNLLTFTDYSGYDPEVTSVGNSITAGTDSGAYPSARTYNFGVTVNF